MNVIPSHHGSNDGPVTPPPIPSSCAYTRCYCEENIYLLADALGRHPDVASQDPRTPSLWDPYVVFISNHQKTHQRTRVLREKYTRADGLWARQAALWHQKAAEGPVVWDYHVVLVLRPRARASRGGETAASCWVYDRDSRCALPSTARDYMGQTFPYACADGGAIPERYVSLFRVVPAEEYLDNFVSDRSHMGADAAYAAPPPPYPPLRGRRVTDDTLQTNLMSSFVAMGAQSEGASGAPAADIKEAQTYGEVLGMSEFLAWLWLVA
ncbi:hypothetical protein PHLGIDRAFT_35193 [Phlebiopsis gigantea 11061_1 CR5-6]|uniref:Protein N-terminal glutamine amidohydrolase n=1 Tax=Phlebiopsis gigantea (strain 11061_1 CR5-6) TaxID=745531 RepID=A0A0C3NRZ9_PHLG1|nr:hypothetical protein PHLGIDRAFT_35193 [Phlebiopsis gigantea 11061_1 CR5-6]